MARSMRVINDVDGHEVADEREPPPEGRDIVAPPEIAPLSEAEDAGLRSALDAAETGRVKPADDVRRRLEDMIARRR